jgi:hypothetical protein
MNYQVEIAVSNGFPKGRYLLFNLTSWRRPMRMSDPNLKSFEAK